MLEPASEKPKRGGFGESLHFFGAMPWWTRTVFRAAEPIGTREMFRSEPWSNFRLLGKSKSIKGAVEMQGAQSEWSLWPFACSGNNGLLTDKSMATLLEAAPKLASEMAAKGPIADAAETGV